MNEIKEKNKLEELYTKDEEREEMTEKKQKNRAQVFNPVTGRWVKINTRQGGIIKHKKSPGKFKNVKVLRKKKRK